jgi:predicted permease
MTALWQDIRYSLRMMRKSPGFTAIALITLAIGIGANAVMFSVTDLLLLRPMKVKEPEQLVCCDIHNPVFGGIPYSAYITIRDSHLGFKDLMAQDDGYRPVTLVYKDTTRQVNTTFVSANYFSFVGVAPIRGRGFLPEEELLDALPVVVLSYRFWQRQGSDPEIMGQYLSLNGIRCQVVGIAPEGFTGITIIGPDLWLPLGSYLAVDWLSRGFARPDGARSDRNYPSLKLVGRLKPGLNMMTAQGRLQTLVPRFKENYPRQWKSNSSLYLQLPPRLSMSVDAEDEHRGSTYFSLVLMGLSAIILIIVCMNLANMLIIHGTRRHREIAIRLALGGGRLRLMRQLLIESLLLALLGGAFGLILAFWGIRILNAWIANVKSPEMLGLRTELSVRVLIATLGFSLIAALLFGLRPALGLSRRGLIAELKESGSAMFLPARRKRSHLSVLCQIALAVVLVLGAALFTRNSLRLARPNYGFSLDDKLVIELDPLSAGYDRIRSAQVCKTLADHLASLPGVKAVGMTTRFFFGGGGPMSICEYAPGGKGDDSRRFLAEYCPVTEVGGDYFDAMGLSLLQGRAFSRLDSTPDAEKVIIIDESLAHKLRPDGKALGCLIQSGFFTEYSEPCRVVGIVPNVQGAEIKKIHAQAYKPVQPDQLCPYLYVRLVNADSVPAMMQRISEEIHKIEPRVPILSMATLAQKHHDNDELWFAGFCTRLALTAGAIALFLAALGIYAVKGYIVASRTPEIGIRMALGATNKDIMGMVFREGIVLTLVGLTVGLLLGLGAALFVRGALYGVSPVDPVSIVVTVVLLGAASLLASYIPARRAAKIDPMEALRYE